MNRFTKAKFAKFFQKKGAKIHYNFTNLKDDEVFAKEENSKNLVSFLKMMLLVHKIWSGTEVGLAERFRALGNARSELNDAKAYQNPATRWLGPGIANEKFA